MSPKESRPQSSDPVQVDPQHYQLELETDRVRVLRVRFGPGEKSVMHAHPAGLVVVLTDCSFHFALVGGRVQDLMGRAGQVISFEEPFEHLPENVSDRHFEAIMVEFKD